MAYLFQIAKYLSLVSTVALYFFTLIQNRSLPGLIHLSSESEICMSCYFSTSVPTNNLNEGLNNIRELSNSFLSTGNPDLISNYVCDKDINISQICETTTASCLKDNLLSDCTLSDFDVEKIHIKSARKKKNYELFLNTFNALISNQDLIKTCCGSNTSCEKRLSEKNLLILNGTKSSAGQHGYHWNKKNIIGVYSDSALKLNTRENIESFLLHELGHACAYSVTPEYNDMDKSSTITWIKSQLKSRLDYETYDCITSSLERRILKNQNSKIDVEQWYDEVFADLIFAKFKNRIRHYAVDCHYKEDSNHSLPVEYFNCWVKSNVYRQAVCN